MIKLLGDLNNFSRFGSIVFTTSELCRVANCSKHVFRDANGCVDNLARYAYEFSDYNI